MSASTGKTYDDLTSFTGTPSLASLIAIRDMSVASNNSEATKKFSLSDLIILVHQYREHIIAQATLTANVATTVTFPTAFDSTPEVGVLRTTQGGVSIGVAVDISNITSTGFMATPIDDCVLTYIAGKVQA